MGPCEIPLPSITGFVSFIIRKPKFGRPIPPPWICVCPAITITFFAKIATVAASSSGTMNKRCQQSTLVCIYRFDRLGSVRKKRVGVVRAALGRRNLYERLVSADTTPNSLTLWSGSLWRIQQVLRTKGHRAVSYGFELPDRQDQGANRRDALRATAHRGGFGNSVRSPCDPLCSVARKHCH